MTSTMVLFGTALALVATSPMPGLLARSAGPNAVIPSGPGHAVFIVEIVAFDAQGRQVGPTPLPSIDIIELDLRHSSGDVRQSIDVIVDELRPDGSVGDPLLTQRLQRAVSQGGFLEPGVTRFRVTFDRVDVLKDEAVVVWEVVAHADQMMSAIPGAVRLEIEFTPVE